MASVSSFTDGPVDAGYRRARRRPSALLLLFIIALIIPIEFSFYLGSLLVTPTRLLFLLLMLQIAAALGRQKLLLFDYLFYTFVAWQVLALMIKGGLAGIEPAGSFFLSAIVPYGLARTQIRTPQDLIAIVGVIAGCVVVLGLLAIPEAVLDTRYLHEFARGLTGFSYAIADDMRLGLLRAATVFEHPILFGVFSACILSLLLTQPMSNAARLRTALPVLLACTLSLSSAAILIYAVQIALLIGERMTRSIKNRVRKTALLAVGTAGFLELASNRGFFGVLIGYLTFNSQTGYYRLLQFEYAIDDVLAHPLIGIDPQQWTRPAWMAVSIDNHWLYQALNGGIPSLVFLLATIALIMRRLYRPDAPRPDPVQQRLRLGWAFTMIALIIGGATVTFFGKMLPIFMFYLGVGAALVCLPHPRPTPSDTGGPAHPLPLFGHRAPQPAGLFNARGRLESL